MNVDTFVIRLVLLVIPGFAGYKAFRTVQSTGKTRKQIKDWQDFLAVVFLSVVSYGAKPPANPRPSVAPSGQAHTPRPSRRRG
jgi:hypothetical protein